MTRLALSALVVFGALACSGTDRLNPGDPVGSFHVTAKLTSTSCGTAPDPWEFDTKLRAKGETLYWINGDEPISGIVDTSSKATLSSSATSTLREADAKNQLPACVVTRTDSLEIAVTDGTSPIAYGASLTGTKALTGTLSYGFSPQSGSECSDQLLSTGGDYQALPCTITYTLTATKTADLPK